MDMNLEERVLRLERANRVLALTSGVVVLVLGVVLLTGAAGERRIADHIDARSVNVLSPSGKSRVELFAQDDGFAGVSIAGIDGKATATLVVLPSGVPNLCFSDTKTCRVVIGNVAGSEALSIQTRTASGETVWTAPAK
jgi:hypothetical protein